MNLYLITQSENDEYDTYDSAVVVADSAEEAVNIHPDDGGDEAVARRSDYWRCSVWASKPENVTAKFIGVADEELEGGTVVLASFNAG